MVVESFVLIESSVDGVTNQHQLPTLKEQVLNVRFRSAQ